MKARIRQFASDLAESFWLLPGGLVLAGILLAFGLVWADRFPPVATWIADRPWLYDGGATGARTLLGAVASSTIGVAGTVFSITIASLSLAAGQMGPRLLRNFTRDRGNQVTLGIFLGTFAYALVVLRSVRTNDEGGFVPHLALSVAILFAVLCVLTLVYFVHHISSRINVDTVIELVGRDLREAMAHLTTDKPSPPPPPAGYWQGACTLRGRRHGYLLRLEADALADWAKANGTCIRLMVRPGDFVFAGAPLALLTTPNDGAIDAIREATVLGPSRTSSADLEYAVRQLVEVAVRALSPGINDPHTAIGVLDHLGAALCDLVGRHLPTNVFLRDGRPVLVAPSFDYPGLADAMFHMIRQSAAGTVSVLIRMLEVLTAVAGAEPDAARIAVLRRHANLVLDEAERSVAVAGDLADLRSRHAGFATMLRAGALGLLGTADAMPAAD